MDGRPIRASKCAANGAKNTGSSSSASTRPNSAGNTNSSDGKIASHNVGWSLTVLSTMASIPSIPRVRGHPPGSAPSDPGSTRRLFQVEVANCLPPRGHDCRNGTTFCRADLHIHGRDEGIPVPDNQSSGEEHATDKYPGGEFDLNNTATTER